ncbi:hypothetical protein MRB53_041146 [Persea americana]|nr:hypothetical protein MRB53_041146 [Persea americana]
MDAGLAAKAQPCIPRLVVGAPLPDVHSCSIESSFTTMRFALRFDLASYKAVDCADRDAVAQIEISTRVPCGSIV